MSQMKKESKAKIPNVEASDSQDTKSQKRSSLDITKTSNFSTRESKLKPILVSTTPGNAIMGYATDDIPSKRLPPLKEIHNNKNLNQEIEAKIESSLVATLQAKCSELGREIEEDKALKKQTEVENSFLKSQIMNMEQEIRQIHVMLNEEKNEKGKLEDRLEMITELLNKSNREVGKLKQELKVSNENVEMSGVQLQNLKKEKENEARSYEEEIERLRKHLDELEEEHEELRNKYHVKAEINTLVEEERSNYVKEMETKSAYEVEAKLEKINKLIGDNATLTEKLAESERLRRKYQERHTADENKIKSLLEKNQYLEESITSLKKQLSDAKSLKSYNHKIYEDKVTGLNEQLEKLKKENLKLRKANNAEHSYKEYSEGLSEETLEPVKAKPYLFGPVDTGKF